MSGIKFRRWPFRACCEDWSQPGNSRQDAITFSTILARTHAFGSAMKITLPCSSRWVCAETEKLPEGGCRTSAEARRRVLRYGRKGDPMGTAAASLAPRLRARRNSVNGGRRLVAARRERRSRDAASERGTRTSHRIPGRPLGTPRVAKGGLDSRAARASRPAIRGRHPATRDGARSVKSLDVFRR